MAFGPIIDVPLLSIVFAFLIKYKNLLVGYVRKIKLPKIVLALLAAVPLIVFEEHINCGAYGCANVIFPPTLLFILILVLIFFGLIKLLRIKRLLWQTILGGLLGAGFEFFLGVARKELWLLAQTNLLTFIFIILWVGVSYAFVLFLPLIIFNGSKQIIRKEHV